MKKQTTVSRILKSVCRQRSTFVFVILCTVLYSVLDLLLPILIGQAIDTLIGAGKVDFEALFVILAKIAIIITATACLQYFSSTLSNRISYNTVKEIRKEAFEHISNLPISYVDSHKQGDLVSRIVSDASVLSDGLIIIMTSFVPGIITIIGTLIFMLTLSPLTGAVVIVLTPLSILLANFISSRTHKMFKKSSGILGEETAYVNEMIVRQKVTDAFSNEDRSMKELEEIDDRYKKSNLLAIFFSSLVNPSTRFINSTIYAIAALIGSFSVIGGALTVGGLSSFLAYANQYGKPFNNITSVMSEMQSSIACAERLFEIIDEPSQSPDDSSETARDNGEVVFDHVYFSYVKDKPLIQDFDFSVYKGKHIALVGPTGCGKTTIINLLLRFYETDSGTIKLGDADITKMPRSDLRNNCTMVLQETWLKSGTIADNIRFGNNEATEEDVINAAKAACADSFIQRLPDKYNTVISNESGNLSEGERQLLCIARAMLHQSSILILDEATSSIDTRTEVLIGKAFDTLTSGRTSIIVAHRLSTIKNADAIIVMKAGIIIEKGNHEELISLGGLYAELYRSQFEK
ncbi:MAG: ABC transporter ATP-binding protein/permease [Clostridiales bacterium]|nr:ABC transporter ATP-binding protein/permease [Clostridiales bacterium]